MTISHLELKDVDSELLSADGKEDTFSMRWKTEPNG
jgi:hypothetical protein